MRSWAPGFPGEIDMVATSSYFGSMRAVGLKALKNKLSQYVKLAAGGETVLVTDRDKVVAELVPPTSGRGLRASDALLADAVRKGWITPPAIISKEPPTGIAVAPLKEILDEISSDRAER